MDSGHLSRRDYLKLMGAGAAVVNSELSVPVLAESSQVQDDRVRRMQWWHQATFGMFIHWGLYSVLGRHEWVMENEAIPVTEYEPLAKRFRHKPNAAREWAA